jgi:hypothetical protein
MYVYVCAARNSLTDAEEIYHQQTAITMRPRRRALWPLEFFSLRVHRLMRCSRERERERRHRFHSLGINYGQSTSIKTREAMNIHRRRSREIGKKFGGLRHLCHGSVCVFMQRTDKLQQSSIKTFNGIYHSLACAQNIHISVWCV